MSLEHVDIALDVELPDATQVVARAWQAGWTIPPQLTVSEWADAHRQIAQGAGAEPGQWRTSRTPYLREIMDCLSDHSPVIDVAFKKSAQIGATEVGINWVGYVIDRGLDSMIVGQPVKDLARSWATAKFDPAVDLMPSLSAKLHVNNTLEKAFPGGTLWIIWANSSKQLRQRTARYIFMDEIDEYPDDLGDQGPADDQLAARSMSYGDRAKRYRACTPTVAGSSKIDAAYALGDQRQYMVPCPHCRVHFRLAIELLGPSGAFACPGCGGEIEEHHKAAMLVERSACTDCGQRPMRFLRAREGGATYTIERCRCGVRPAVERPDGAYWQPTAIAQSESRVSYHLWAAYTPMGLGPTWRAIAEQRAEAEAKPEKQAGFTNLTLGEVFHGERTQQDAEEVGHLAEPGVHRGVVPRGALILTAGVDLQHDRAEIQILGIGRGQRCRVVDYLVVDCDPSRPDGFGELDAVLQQTWHNQHGKPMHVSAVAIDGGNWTESAAQFVKAKVGESGRERLVAVGAAFRRQKVYLVRGRSEKKSDRAVYRPSKTEVGSREKTIARSVGVWGVGGSVLKHMVTGWINGALAAKERAERDGTADDPSTRMLRFPGGRGEPFDPINPDPGALPPTYYKGLTVEYFDHVAKRWICPRGGRNEPLDTLVYAVWAALSPAVKMDTIREAQWQALEAELEPDVDLFTAPLVSRETPPSAAPASAPPAASNASRGTQRAGGIVDGDWSFS